MISQISTGQSEHNLSKSKFQNSKPWAALCVISAALRPAHPLSLGAWSAIFRCCLNFASMQNLEKVQTHLAHLSTLGFGLNSNWIQSILANQSRWDHSFFFFFFKGKKIPQRALKSSSETWVYIGTMKLIKEYHAPSNYQLANHRYQVE